MTQKAAAELLHMASSTLSDVLHRLITRLRDGHRIIDIEKLGLDEISYCKGSKFATIVYDLERKCVVWVAAGKGRATIDEFFKNVITKEQREKVRFASCDMSKTYMGAIKTWCTNAVLVIDRFHIVKALNEAVDAVRKDAWHEAKGDQKKVLKGLRWLLYKHSRNRTKAETQNLKNLNKSNRHIFRASVLKDEFEAFWNFVNPAAAESFLKGWITAALKSRIPSLRTFAKTLKTYATDILSFIGTNVNNAVAEGINRVIKIVKNRASGFANLNAFTDMIFLTVGDLDLPMQIPEPFRLF
jgi:transposase